LVTDRGRDFGDAEHAQLSVDQDQIGEGSTDIDSHQ
jgi:hypothetical protein